MTKSASTYKPNKAVGYEYLSTDFRFFCNSDKGFRLYSENDKITLEVGDLSLKGFRLIWNSQEKSIKVLTDKYSLYPLLVFSGSDSESSLWFSNTSEYFPSIEPTFRLSQIAVNQFFTQGYLMPNNYFIDNVKRVSGSWSHVLGQEVKTHDCRWTEELLPRVHTSVNTALRDARVCFLDTIDRIIANHVIDEFFLSGGLDSRTIAIAIKLLGREFPKVKIFSSSLSQSNDLDFEIAKLFCSKENISFSAEEHSSGTSSYFRDSIGKSTLSGLYGGDLLGGCWENCLFPPVTQRTREFSLSREAEIEGLQYLRDIQSLSPLAQELLAQQVFTHSDRSILFSNLNYGWASPLANLRVSVSPFATSSFIEHTLSIPQNMRRNYRFYHRFYRTLNDNDRLPLCSFYTHFYPEYSPSQTLGDNPKAEPIRDGKVDADNNSLFVQVLSFLSRRGIRVDEDRFMINSNSPYFKTLCRSFHSAFCNHMTS